MNRFIACVLAVIISVMCARAEDIKIRLIPTYENCSVYLEGADGEAQEYKLSYRKTGTQQWLPAHKLVRSETNMTLRTSIFRLTENTEYEVRVNSAKGDAELAQNTVKTWNSNPPVAKTIYLNEVNPNGDPYLIENGGTKDGWVRYVGATGYEIKGGNEEEEAVLVSKASYVIIENLKVVGGLRHALMLKASDNVIIRNCDFSGWGRVGKQITKEEGKDGKYYLPGEKSAINWDAGVNILHSEKVTVEKSYFHDPRNRANSWFYSHPAGPCAVFMQAKGEIVIRYNDMPGSDKHRWNDVIESWGNGKINGGFVRDSDIYGNYLAFSNDDGIELDGGQCNVRFYENKIEGSLCGVSTAANLVGPSFVMNNLVVNLGDERGSAGSVIKNGGGDTYSKGKTFFYNNTFFTRGRGIAGVGYGSDKNRAMFYGETANNLICTASYAIAAPFANDKCDFDYDTISTADGKPGTYEPEGKIEKNGVVAGIKFTDPVKGNLMPVPAQKGLKDGRYIVGVNAPAQDSYSKGAINGSVKALPYRNNIIEASQTQVILNADLSLSKDAAVAVTFKLSENYPKEEAFSVITNTTYTWLKVSPASGKIKPGQTITVNIGVDRASVKTDTINPGCVVFKLESGDSFPVTVYIRVYSQEFSFVKPASECPGAAKFKETGTDEKTGYKLLDFKAESERKQGENKITFKFKIQRDGKYMLSALTVCPTPFGQHDSLFMSLDGGKITKVGLTENDPDKWNIIRQRDAFWALSAGEHTIDFYPRESLYLKAFRVSSVTFPLVGE